MAPRKPYRYKDSEFLMPSWMGVEDLDWVAFAWGESSRGLQTIVLGPGSVIERTYNLHRPQLVHTGKYVRPTKGFPSMTAWHSHKFLRSQGASLVHQPVLVDFAKDGMRDRILDLHPKWFGERSIITLGDAMSYGDQDVQNMIVDHAEAVLARIPAASTPGVTLEGYLTSLVAGFTGSVAPLNGFSYGSTLQSIDDCPNRTGDVSMFTHSVPQGTFGASTWMDDRIFIYLLSGSVGDPDATILGRVEMPNSGDGFMRAFKGGGVAGGERLINVGDLKSTFSRMI